MKKKGLPLWLLPVTALAMFHSPALSFDLEQRSPPTIWFTPDPWPMDYDAGTDGFRAYHISLETNEDTSISTCVPVPTAGATSLSCGFVPPGCLDWEMTLTTQGGVVPAYSPNNAATTYETRSTDHELYINAAFTSECEVDQIIYVKSRLIRKDILGSNFASTTNNRRSFTVPAGTRCTLSGPNSVFLGGYSVEQIQAGVISDEPIILSGGCSGSWVKPLVTVKSFPSPTDGSFLLGEDMKMFLTVSETGNSVPNGSSFSLINENTSLLAHLSPASPDTRVTGGEKTATLEVTLSIP